MSQQLGTKSTIISAALSTTCVKKPDANPCNDYSPASYVLLLLSLLAAGAIYMCIRYSGPGVWGAANCINGAVGTLDDTSTPTCATEISSPGSNWLSLNVPAGTRVGDVQIFNRHDYPQFRSWLGTFELWLGSSAGEHDPSAAVKCGEVTPARMCTQNACAV